MDENAWRVGDRERKTVADRLQTALGEGRLDLAEYDERLQRTYLARTNTDLEVLVSDLTPGPEARAGSGDGRRLRLAVECVVALVAVTAVANVAQFVWPVLFWLSWVTLFPAAAVFIAVRHTRPRSRP